MSFGVRLKDVEDLGVVEYLEGLKPRSGGVGFNPFNILFSKYNGLFVFSFKPIFPPVWKFLFLISAGLFVIWGWSNWLLLPVLGGLLTFLFWWDRFYYFMMVLGLRKKGFVDVIEFVSASDVVVEVLLYGSD